MAQVAMTRRRFQPNLSQIIDADEKDCKLLRAAYNIAATFAKRDSLVKEHTLEFDPHFFDQVKQGIADLKVVDRPILVIGETSAGKSSFLNLLIGRRVLPELTAPCTHCICRIKKGRKLEAHVTSFDGSTPSEVVINGDGMTDDKFRAQLKALVNADNCAQALDRCMDIFVPSDILQDNVYLVDTPGFGDSATVTKTLVQFLPKAMGIIFILNPTVSLGIAEDRGALILDEIKRLHKDGKIPSFDPTKIVFIANKWDQVDEDERKDHRELIINRMETLWPNFRKDQLLPLSVLYVRKTQHRDPEDYRSASMDYQTILDKVHEVVQHCANARSSVHTRYLLELFWHLKSCLAASCTFSGLSTMEKHTKSTDLHTLMADLELTYEQAKETLNTCKSEFQNAVVQHIHQYLNNDANRESIFTWEKEGIPKGDNYADVKHKARIAIRGFISHAISTCIADRDTEVRNITDQISKLTSNIAEKQSKMECFLKNIKSDYASAKENATELPTKESDISIAEIAAIVITSPLWIPLGLASLVTVVPVTFAICKYKTNGFRERPNKHLERWTTRILKEEYTLEALDQFLFDQLTRKIQEILLDFSKQISNYRNILKHLKPGDQHEAVVSAYAETKELCCQLENTLPKLQ